MPEILVGTHDGGVGLIFRSDAFELEPDARFAFIRQKMRAPAFSGLVGDAALIFFVALLPRMHKRK